MAAVELTISGVLYDKLARTTRPVVLIGEASLTGLGVGGGPIIPPGGGGGGGGDGDHIWGGGGVPMPNPPIANVPGAPGYRPPSDAHPEHPIVIPPTEPPTGQPDDDGFIKPPPEGGGWAFHQTYGWMYDPPMSGPKT